MGMINFSRRSKAVTEPAPTPTLVDVLQEDKIKSQPVLLRPASSEQKALMIEAVISARKETWSKGGYIFVTRQDASEVIQALAENRIAYEIFNLSGTHENAILRTLTHPVEDQQVVVYVDDETLPASKRNEDLKRFLGKVIEQCRKWDDEPAPESWRFMPVFYIDINLPTVSGFAHRMRQVSKQFGTFVLSSKNTFDREVDQRTGYHNRDQDELKSVIMNSVGIYGGGRRNHSEILNAYSLSASARGEAESLVTTDDLDRMKDETILGMVTDPEQPRVIRLPLLQ